MAEERTTTLKGSPLALIGPQLAVGDPAPDFTVAANDLSDVTLASTGGGTRVFLAVPSLDTPVCDAEVRKFNEEATSLGGVKIFTVSCDLPFAQSRWCGAAGVEDVTTVSDYKSGSFGEAWGVMIEPLRIHSRAVFVVNGDNEITYVEYVPEVAEAPDYEAAIAAAKAA
jgi:thiol peroxidase